jgi:hypothetical protein
MIFQNPSQSAFRHLLIPRIAAANTSFRPLPCQTWHNYMDTSAYRVEVEVGADGPASAPLSGAAAAVPPAGAHKPDFIRLLEPRLEGHTFPAADTPLFQKFR